MTLDALTTTDTGCTSTN